MSIEVNHLTKIYGSQKAVDNISFQLHKGEVVGFLGPNGAGKSTTMKVITGYIRPDAGQVKVSGIRVDEFPGETKKRIGYLPEANPLYYDMYVREYLEFMADIHQVPRKKERIEEVITLVGLTQESRKKTGQLSKGYKQRVGLAAALIHDPEVLILDEPTTGLDPNQIMEIREVIRNLGKTRTVLFSSHILQEVEAICDRVIIINKGKLVADDSLDNLVKGMKGQSQVNVRYKEAVDADALSFVEEGSDRLIQQGPGNFTILTDDAEKVKRQLLEHSLQHKLNIVSLQSGEQRLEEVFRDLTGQEGNM